MAFVSVTRLRIRSLRFMPHFGLLLISTRRQVRVAPGFKRGSLLADRQLVFWTLTVWESAQAMRDYMLGGSHRAAMPHLVEWCDEASVAHWDTDGDDVPAWPDADRRMRETGRASKVRHPSPRHATLSYRPLRFAAALPIAPLGESPVS
jgi:heme-degrading monooxygenase HmoA